MDIRNRVKTARLLAGLTAEQLAERIGVARINVVRWESIRDIPRKQLSKVADACGVNVDFLSSGALEGLVIARPGRHIALNTKRRSFEYLEGILPALTEGARSIEVVGFDKSIWLYCTNTYCLAVMPDGEMRFEQKSNHAFVETGEKQVRDAYGNDQSIGVILEVAGLSDLFSLKQAANILVTLRIRVGCTGEKDALDRIAEAVEGIGRSSHDVQFEISKS